MISFGEAIEICRERGWKQKAAESTLHVAEIFAQWERFDLAAKYLGLTVCLRVLGSSSAEEEELKRTGGLVRELRVTLGCDEFDRLCAEGSQMSLRDALDSIANWEQEFSQASIS